MNPFKTSFHFKALLLVFIAVGGCGGVVIAKMNAVLNVKD